MLFKNNSMISNAYEYILFCTCNVDFFRVNVNSAEFCDLRCGIK